MDAIYYKVRTDGYIINRSAYVVLMYYNITFFINSFKYPIYKNRKTLKMGDHNAFK